MERTSNKVDNSILKKNIFKNWLYENRFPIITIFLIYEISIISIGIINYPYIDDAARRIHGNADFGLHYARWGSEYLSRIVQGSRHLTDMGITTHLLTGLILTVASVILVYALTKKIRFMTAISSTMLGLNPWFLQCISFRFDSPYMAMSILFSVLPFLWWKKNAYIFFGTSIFSVFMVFNTYQSSSGIYILMLLSLTYMDIISGDNILVLIKKVLFSLFSFCLALLLFVVEMKFNPQLASRGEITNISPFKDIFSTFIHNCSLYFSTILKRSAKQWVILVALIIIIFVINSYFQTKISKITSIFISIVYVILSAISSFGVYLVFTSEIATESVRYSYGFAVFITIIVIISLNNSSYKITKKILNIVVGMLCYYIITFTFVFSSSLYYQNESFEIQSAILVDDLKNVISEDITEIFSDRLFKNSPIVENTARNYPILMDIVPNSESLYWPNIQIFQTYSGIDLEIKPYDPSLQNFSKDEILIDNIYRIIYKKDNSLFIVNK